MQALLGEERLNGEGPLALQRGPELRPEGGAFALCTNQSLHGCPLGAGGLQLQAVPRRDFSEPSAACTLGHGGNESLHP